MAQDTERDGHAASAEIERLRRRIVDLERELRRTAVRRLDDRGPSATADLENLVQRSPMGIHFYRLEDDGRLVFTGANPTADRLLGIENRQFVGLTIEEAFPPLADTEIPDRYRAAAATGTPWSTEHLVYRDEVISGAFEVFAFQTAPMTMAAMFLDITARKREEQARLEMREKIQQAQKLESLGVLAGGIAHDFNNLLVGILGNADLALLDLPATSPARACVEGIESAARRAADLARQMLAYSGKGRFLIEPIDLGRLVAEMAPLLVVAASKRATIIYDVAADTPPIEADASQIGQVLMNLVTNAAEAIADRNGAIAVRAGAQACDREYLAGTYLDDALPAGRYVFLEVEDDGCGMDEPTIDRIFEPFYSTKFTGRGLGLAAVLGIVRGHRGAIDLRSAPGAGTRFRVLFPAVERTPARPSADGRAPAEWSGSGVALLVDDDATIREIGAAMLARLGFEVEVATDGRSAIELFAAAPDRYACVLLDLTMPRVDGEECFRELRRIRGDVVVLLSSGYNEQDAINRFAGGGLAGFVQKPYRLADLREKLRRALS